MVSGNLTTKKRTPAMATRPLAIRLPAPPREDAEKLGDLEVHLFDDRRRCIGTTTIQQMKAETELAIGRSRYVRAVIAPKGMHPEAAIASSALPSLSYEVRDLKTIDFQIGWWKNLVLGQAIFYRGHVEKVIGDSALPICDGTVEVYEVDPFLWIWKLSDIELARVRNELLPRLSRTPSIPIPPPGPLPAPPLLAGKSEPGMRAEPSIAVENRMSAMGHDGVRALTATEPNTLAMLDGMALRNHLYLNRYALLPYLCLLTYPWWYTKTKIGEVAIRPDGTFFGFAGWWLPGQDRPDLYFRVRQSIDGVERVIYSPPVACSTWWDYTGQDVPIRVTDPLAVCCNDSIVAEDDQVVFLGLGFDTTTDVAGAQGLVQTGNDVGLYRYANGKLGPFAGAVHVALDVDIEGLNAAGVRYFKLSYRRGLHNSNDNESDWTALVTPLFRHYRHVVGTIVSYPTLSLVPTAGSLPASIASTPGVFRFPEIGHDYVVIDAADRAFGVWDTDALVLPGQTAGDVADRYTLRLQVYDSAGNDVTATTPVLRISGQQFDGTYTTTALNANHAFLYVHVDGRAMEAEINDVIDAGTTSTGTGCGFLTASPTAEVRVGVKAYHPGGIGFGGDPDRFIDSWSYVMTRGAAATTVVNYADSTSNVGDSSNFYALPNGGVPAQTVDDLLAGIATVAGVQRRCTFNIRLHANTLTRNGYGVLSGLNDSDTASFALIDRSTV